MKATLYTDGGARGNPGPAGIGFVLRIGKRESIEVGKYIGETTNNQAEYQALIAGMERARREKVNVLECVLDSELVVKQIAREYRVRDADLKPHYAKICELIRAFDKVTFTHVRREKNKEADWLVNEVLDKHVNG